MIAHINVIIVLFVAGMLFLFCAYKFSRLASLTFGLGTIALAVSCVFLIWTIYSYLNYLSFEEMYETQRQIFETYNLEDSQSIIYNFNIFEINNQLANYQASKQLWGWWSCIPDRVMDLIFIS